MMASVEPIVDQVKRLERSELDELLGWLADQELAKMDTWDEEIERDSRPGGRLEAMMARAREHIAVVATGGRPDGPGQA